jgi:hypothetical protein
MRLTRLLIQVAIAAAACAPTLAQAQLGMYQLPKDDFIWNWGRTGEASRTAFEDFEVRGGELGFSCVLTGGVGASGRLSPSDIRELENTLRSRMDFIYAAATYMNDLVDVQRAISWARLKCEKFEPTPSTEEEKAEREARAKEKMQKEIERRRARARD